MRVLLSVLLSGCVAQHSAVDPPDGGPPDFGLNEAGPSDARPLDGGFWDARAPDPCSAPADETACADADCHWRGARCTSVADCTQVGTSRLCRQAGCGQDADTCFEPDDPERCDAVGTPERCVARDCHWQRPRGAEAHLCLADPPPTVRECNQPDGPSCEGAGCEWTGEGCAPPNQAACTELNFAACEARAECFVEAGACRADEVACDRLAEGDCAPRDDCGWNRISCRELPGDDCRELGEWACEQRRDCAPARPICPEQEKQRAPPEPDAGQAAAPDAGAGGGGGAGGAAAPYCGGPEDCGDGQGCVDGTCIPCGRFLGCFDAP